MYNVGQISPNSEAGKLIYDLSSRIDVLNIVEIGTWSGLGTTLCVINAIKNGNLEKNFFSIELYPEMFDVAVNNLKDNLKFVKLLNGRIIEFDDIFWFDHKTIDYSPGSHASLYYHKDISLLKNSKNVIDQIPQEIDLLILDGGEYTTYPEWIKLKDRTRIVILDDSNILKCNRIRQEILESKLYVTLFDNIDLRNGFSIFERKK